MDDWIYPAILAITAALGTAWQRWVEARVRLEERRLDLEEKRLVAEERRGSGVVYVPPLALASAPPTAPSPTEPPDGSSAPSGSPPPSRPAPSS